MSQTVIETHDSKVLGVEFHHYEPKRNFGILPEKLYSNRF